MSTSQEPLDSSDEDVFECGRCKDKFTAMEEFMVHKKGKQCHKNRNNSNSNASNHMVEPDVSTTIPVPVMSSIMPGLLSHTSTQGPVPSQHSNMATHAVTSMPGPSMLGNILTRGAAPTTPGPKQGSSVANSTGPQRPHKKNSVAQLSAMSGNPQVTNVLIPNSTLPVAPHVDGGPFEKPMRNQRPDLVAVKKGTLVQSLDLRPSSQLQTIQQPETRVQGAGTLSESDRSAAVDIIRQASIASGIEIADQFAVADDHNNAHGSTRIEETSIECTFCSVKIKTIAELQSHYSDVHNIAEQKAKQLAKEKQKVINRVKLNSRRLKMEMKEHRKLPSYTCRICDISFKTAAKLTKHRKTKKHLDKKDQIQENKRSSRRKADVIAEEEDYSEEQGPLKCASCDYETSEMRELRDHLSSHKKHSGKFVCNDCDLVFSSRADLSSHSIAEHGKEIRRPYKNRKVQCSECGQQVQQRSLAKHKRTHGESKPELQCPLCRHEASKENEFETHIENHKVWVPLANEAPSNPANAVPSGVVTVDASGMVTVNPVPNIIGQIPPGSNPAVMTTGNPSSTIDLSSLGLEHIRTMQAAESLAQMCPENNMLNNMSDAKQREENDISDSQGNDLVVDTSISTTDKEDEHSKDGNNDEKGATKSKNDQLKCRECNTFQPRTELVKHMWDKHRMVKMFLCRDLSCRLTYNDMQEFCNHMVNHPGCTVFQCSCRKCLRKGNIDPGHKAELKKEKMRVYYQQMSFKCVKCWVKFPSQAGLDRHLAKETHNYPCPECDKVHVSKRQLRIHMITHQTERQYLCEKCGQDFKTPRDLQRHSISHSNIKPFQCIHCGKGFSFRNKLHRHILTVHTAVKPFTCSEPGCTKAFARKDKLVDHQRTHLSYEPFKCEFCQRGFFRKDNLKDHLVLHTGEFRFRCDICSKGFMRPKLLERHKKAEHAAHEMDHHTIVDPTYQLCTIDGQSISCQELGIKDVNSQVQIQVKLTQ